jgi:hypothetical protein
MLFEKPAGNSHSSEIVYSFRRLLRVSSLIGHGASSTVL